VAVDARGVDPVTVAAGPWPQLYSTALSGAACVMEGIRDEPHPLPVLAWADDADPSDEVVLRQCTDPTLDVGCGPGRLAHALALRGLRVLGVDVVPEAVRRTRARGVAALQRDVFDALPGEGRWGCVLLADGNIGIGGDPHALLRRSAGLLAPGGRVVVDLAPFGQGLVTRVVRVEADGWRSEGFRWSLVGADVIAELAVSAGLRPQTVHEHQGRWFAVLTKDRR
jgi:SAM-dependent methyltransferase